MKFKESPRSVQERVYWSLRKSIRSLNLLPGTIISEMEISTLYEVSRTPVREAFIRLSEESLVDVIPQKETVVSLIDINRAKQEFFLRESLEKSVYERFIECAGEAHFAELEMLLIKQKNAYENKQITNFVDYDDSFHQLIFYASDQKLSWNIIDSMSGHHYRMRLLSIFLNGVAEDIIIQHYELLECLKSKDLISAQKNLKNHIGKLKNEEKILLSKFPDYFSPSAQNEPFENDFGGLRFD